MSAEAVIRDGCPSDANAVAEIAVAAWQPIYAHARVVLGEELFRQLHTDWEARKAGQVRRVCQADTRGAVLVATVDGCVVGFVSYTMGENAVGEIGNNAVRPDWQSQGIATRLYEAALDRMRDAGGVCVKVSTGGDPAHAAARRAYEKVGFGAGLPSITYHMRL